MPASALASQPTGGDPSFSPAKLLPDIVAAVEAASAEILAIYRSGFTVRTKADASPVTEADEAAERIILPRLAALLPGVPARNRR